MCNPLLPRGATSAASLPVGQSGLTSNTTCVTGLLPGPSVWKHPQPCHVDLWRQPIAALQMTAADPTENRLDSTGLLGYSWRMFCAGLTFWGDGELLM